MSTLACHADSWTAVEQPIIPSCEESWFILCDDGCLQLQMFGVAKPVLLLATLGAGAVGGRAVSVFLAGGYKVSQILVKVNVHPQDQWERTAPPILSVVRGGRGTEGRTQGL